MAKFQPGQSGNPAGRPKRSVEEKYLKKISSSVTLTEWREIVKKAVEQAKRGDAKARQWLSDYLVGKPVQGVDLTSDNIVRFLVEYESDGLQDNTTQTT